MKEILKLKRTRLFMLLPIGALFILLARLSPFIAEYIFARGLYKILSLPLGLVTGIFPFSLAELIIVLSPFILLSVIICFVARLIKNKANRGMAIKKAAVNVLCFISVATFLFIVLCGTNYYRYTFAGQYNLNVKERTVEELKELCVYLKRKAEESKAAVDKKDRRKGSCSLW